MNDKQLISFDYAIKYLLRDKGNYEIVEGFISALLQSKGYNRVKILALLESESNKEDRKSKRSIADLIVEDTERNKYIIEIERNVKDSFVHKSLFNTSRLIIDNLAQREDYTQILKVFHISLLYFPIGNGAIHHGETIIREIETKEKLIVHIKNQETGETFDAVNILPEYFFISIPLFNDHLEREIDDWLYVIKHEEVPDNFHSPYMEKVREKLSILKMNEEDRAKYSYYQKQIYTDRDELQAAIERGKAEGIAAGKVEGKAEGRIAGKNEEKVEIAKKLIEQNVEINTISIVTGLSTEEIKKL